tara:strand:- start:1237 stop:3225 length:1989 start_codon:yes stop_codon:yes gene_type:complete
MAAPILPVGTGIGPVRSNPINVGGLGSAEAAFRKDAASGGMLGELLGMYPTQTEAINARKSAQSGILQAIKNLTSGSGSTLSDDLNVTPPRGVYGRSPERTREAAMKRLESIFRGGGLLRPDDQQGQSVIADLIGGDEIDIFSPDSSAGGIGSERMPLTGGGDQPGDATFGGTIPESRDQNLDVDIGAAGLGVEPPAGTEGSTPSTTTTGGADSGEEAGGLGEANAGQGLVFSGTSKGAEDPKKKTTNPYEQALADAMQSVEESFSGEPKKKKSIEDYKADFAKATGIDVSGEVDKSQALMAFGLALMQNKAGKGFNVGNMLSSVGAAGEKAMPALAAARAEARAGQLAGGKYALQQTATDSANEAALAKERRQALAKVNENILDFQQKRQLANEKHEMDMLGKNADNRTKVIEAHIEAGGKANEITKPWETTPISGMEKNIVIRKAWSQAQGKDIFVDGDAAAESVAIAYGNVNQAESTIDDLEEIVMQIGTQTGSPALDVLFGRASKLGSALGFGDNIMSKDIKVDGEVIKGVTAESTAKAIQDRMIAQYKRFLTQETGNGISEGDVQRIKDLLGEISILTVPKEKAMRLQELREIFKTPKKQVASVMSQLADRNNYINDNEHKRALAKLQDATSYQSANLGLKVTESDSGMLTFDLTQS